MAMRGAVNGGRRGAYSSLSSFPFFFRTTKHSTVSTSYPLSKPIPYPHLYNAGPLVSVRALSEVAAEPKAPRKEDGQSSENWKVKMLYDGECPLCMREVNMLMERDKQYGAIKFVDISSDKFSAEENQGLDYETAMGRIHAILSDGTVVTDVVAFRKLYEAVGLGWVYAITKYEPIATIADSVYGIWAKYRLPITGRPPLEQVLEARRNKGELCNSDKECKM